MELDPQDVEPFRVPANSLVRLKIETEAINDKETKLEPDLALSQINMAFICAICMFVVGIDMQ